VSTTTETVLEEESPLIPWETLKKPKCKY